MITLGSLILFMALSALLGKHTRRPGLLTFLVVALIALIQVGLVLYDIYTIQPPLRHP